MPLSSVLKKRSIPAAAEEQDDPAAETVQTETKTINHEKMDKYVNAIQKIKENDYTLLDDPSDPLSIAINDLSGHISGDMRKALEHVVDLSIHSSESLAAISFLTGDMREVADSTQTIAAAVEELNATSGNISKSSHEVVENSQTTQEAISSGHAAVESSVQSIDLIAKSMDTANSKIQNLSESVSAIVEILATIENIAKQTNLLALNATIEAARAGDAGKGFAVVATEVKTLAGQTATATEDIRDKINAISSGMDEVSGAMVESVGATDTGRSNIHKAGDEINRVVENISAMTELMASVAASVAEENDAIREIAKSIDVINEKTTKAAQNAETATAVTTQTAKVIDEQLATYQEMDLPYSIFEFAKSDHILWKKKLAAMLVGQDNLTADELSDHHHCRLGKWYYETNDEKIKKHPSYIKMEEVHERVHTFGRKCAELFGRGERENAAKEYEKMSEASKDVLQYLDDIKKSVIHRED